MQWFRHYVGLARDPKMVSVAAKSGQTVERVVWVWCAILEGCSDGDTPGADIDADEVAYFLRCSPADITSILEQMEAVGLLENGNAVAWQRRQFKTDNVTERVRKHRERKRSESETLHVTERNVTETPPETETDSDTDREREGARERASPAQKVPKADKRGTRLPEHWEPPPHGWKMAVDRLGERDAREQLAMFRDHWHSKSGKDAVKLDWLATWRNWVRRAPAFQSNGRYHGPDPPQRLTAEDLTPDELKAARDRLSKERRTA